MPAPNFHTSHYVGAFQNLMPRGRVWPTDPDAVLTALITGLCAEPARVNARANDLLVDSFPATAVELLPEWEATLGLPERWGYTGGNVHTRQAQVVAALTGAGGQSIDYFVGLGLSLGYSPIQINQYRPFSVADTVDKPIFGPAWAFAWKVNGPIAGDHTSLELAFRQYAPEHTVVIFNYIF